MSRAPEPASLLTQYQTALVHIEVNGRNAEGRQAPPRVGAGVIVGQAGLILTARHVVGQDDEWEATTPGSGVLSRTVKVVGLDGQRTERPFGSASVWLVPGYDLALLEVTAQNLLMAPVAEQSPGDSGKLVALIWDPGGVPRQIDAELEPTNTAQHNGMLTVRIAVTEGHSGSGLFDAAARLTGIIVNRLDDNRALALPVALIREHIAARVRTARTAGASDPDPARHPEMTAEMQTLRGQLASVSRELNWVEQSRAQGWYELFELRKELDQYGDSTQRTRLYRIHGPDQGRIDSLPYKYSAAPGFGTCVLRQMTDEQSKWSDLDLPRADTVLHGSLTLTPPATATDVHAGFTVSMSLINSFAMTPDEAQQRGQQPIEYTTIRARYPARILRLIVLFPDGYQPEEIRIVAQAFTDDSAQGAEDSKETARVASSLYFDRERGYAVLSVERSLPDYQYVLSWRLPPPPEPPWDEVTRAREQVRALFGLGEQERNSIEDSIASIRDGIWQKFSKSRSKGKPKLHLSVLAFDEPASVIRVVFTTMGDEVSSFPSNGLDPEG